MKVRVFGFCRDAIVPGWFFGKRRTVWKAALLSGVLLGSGPQSAVMAQGALISSFRVYEGHDGGVSCGSGEEVVRNELATPITYCLSVTNTSSSLSFTSSVVNIPLLSYANDFGPLGPNGSFSFHLEEMITTDMVVVATLDAGGPVSQQDSDRVQIDVAVECPSTCFIISDVNNSNEVDNFYIFDTVTLTSQFVSAITDPGSNGLYCLESLTFEPPLPGNPPENLYTVESCRPGDPTNAYLGTIDWKDPLLDPLSVPGTFRQVGGPIGSGTGLVFGVVTNINMIDIDGLEFDDGSGALVLYASVRRDEIGAPDLLIQLDPLTGAIIPGAFGGYDFVQIGPVTSVVEILLPGPTTLLVTNVLDDVDDIAINDAGQMYVLANNDGTADVLAEVDPTTGMVITNFPLRDSSGADFNDMEGLSFDPIRDNFYGTSGSAGGSTADSIFLIGLSGTNLGRVVTGGLGNGVTSTNIPGTGDYEGSDCFLALPEVFSTISGRVFWDLQEDADYDGSEAGTPLALVVLVEDVNTNGVIDTDGSGAVVTDLVVGATVTDVAGLYQFVVSIGKEYLLWMPEAFLPEPASGLTTPNPIPISYPDLCGVDLLAPDFGLSTPPVLGDFVWNDLDRDGIQDAGEPGLSNITVNVYDANSMLWVAGAVTDGSGFYQATLPGRSNYVVEVLATTAYHHTLPLQGGDPSGDSNVLAADQRTGTIDMTVVPSPADLVYSNMTVDAGFYLLEPSVALEKTVSADENCPGQDLLVGTNGTLLTYCFVVQNTGETRLDDLLLTDSNLAVSIPLGTLLVGQAVTTSVSDVLTMDLTNTAVVVGNPVDDEGVDIQELSDVSARDLAEVDLVTPGIELMKMVYENDLGADCSVAQNAISVFLGSDVTYCMTVTNTGDTFLSDVLIEDPLIGLSMPLGMLAPGTSTNLSLEFSPTVDTLNTATVSAVSSSSNGVPYELIPPLTASDTAMVDVVFPTASIGDTVWHDFNADGLQDGGPELGIGGILVDLLTNGVVVASTLTDTNGVYAFTNLFPGSYSIRVTPGFGFRPTLVNQGGDDELDSDIDPTTGLSAEITLAEDEANTSLDGGLLAETGIGDTVWEDVNYDSLPNENLALFGITNVSVRLFRVSSGGITNLLSVDVTGVTVSNIGHYAFTNLLPGLYYVDVDVSTVPPRLQNVRTTAESYLVLLAAGEVVEDADFGFRPEPTAISLRSFSATVDGEDVTLHWVTASEIDNLGFHLYRGDSVDGLRTRVNTGIVLGQGSGIGAEYRYIDHAVAPGRWYYWLEDMEYDESTQLHGPLPVQVEAVEPAMDREGTVVEAVGLARIPVLNPGTVQVRVNGAPVSALELEEGVLVYVPSPGSTIEVEEGVPAPLRMESVDATPASGQTMILAADPDGQVSFTTAPRVDNYLVIGYEAGGLYVLDVTDPRTPRRLRASVLDTGGGAAAYLRLESDEPARVHAAEPRAVLDVDLQP